MSWWQDILKKLGPIFKGVDRLCLAHATRRAMTIAPNQLVYIPDEEHCQDCLNVVVHVDFKAKRNRKPVPPHDGGGGSPNGAA